MSHLDEVWKASDHIPGTSINVVCESDNGYLVALIKPSYCGEAKAIENARKIAEVNNLIRALGNLVDLIDVVGYCEGLPGSATMAEAREVLARAKGGG